MRINGSVFTVVVKGGNPYIMWEHEHRETRFLRIWCAKSDTPYVKYGGSYCGKTYLTPEMIEDLRKLMQ